MPTSTQKEIDNITKLFHVSDNDLREISKAYVAAFRRGLQLTDQSVVMGPSFVTHVAKGNEKGSYLTLDISWASLQVSKIDLDGNRSFNSTAKVFDMSPSLMKADASEFFDFLAKCVKEFVTENAIRGLDLGLTFPFAVLKTAVNNAKLLGWSKGYSIKGAIGQDVVQLFQNALDRQKTNVKCVAILNDTVAALLSESYLSAPCIMSVIYGAGTNGSYTEVGTAITKDRQFQGASTMMINTEWGAFKERGLLKPNVYDDQLDRGAANPGTYLFQKMTCWYYLGELARLVFLSLVQQSPGLLFGGIATDALKKKHGFPSLNLFQIEEATDIQAVKSLIVQVLGYRNESVSDEDAEIVRQICTLVAVRGAKLAACPISALLTHLGYSAGTGGSLPLAVDGELFIGSTQFESRLKQSMATIIGRGIDDRLEFHKVKNGGVVGAAIGVLDAGSH